MGIAHLSAAHLSAAAVAVTAADLELELQTSASRDDGAQN